MRTFAVLFCLASLPAQSQPPVFQSETKVVLVDAVVTDKKGQYVRDLTAKDFRVWEDNRKQTVKSFSLEANSSSSEPRRLVLFLDNIGMSVPDQMTARQALMSFVDLKAGPKNLMAAVAFDGTFHVLQGFTDNPARLKEALRNLRLTASTANDIGMGPAQTASARGLIPSVTNLARNLNAVPGRKIVVLLTGPASLATTRQPDVDSLIQVGNRSDVAIFPILPLGSAAPAGPYVMPSPEVTKVHWR